MNSLVIIDYGAGNLFGLKQACLAAGLNPVVTNNKRKISEAKGLILPGVGSFNPAIEMLKTLEIIESIRSFASSGKTLLGLCLGMQLLLDKSVEFGEHEIVKCARVFKFQKTRSQHVRECCIFRK